MQFPFLQFPFENSWTLTMPFSNLFNFSSNCKFFWQMDSKRLHLSSKKKKENFCLAFTFPMNHVNKVSCCSHATMAMYKKA